MRGRYEDACLTAQLCLAFKSSTHLNRIMEMQVRE